MPNHQLRHYQTTAIERVWQHLAESDGHCIGVLPTGTGKSLVIAEFIRRALTEYPGTRILVLQHVRELIQQNMAELLKHWKDAPVGVFSAGMAGRTGAHRCSSPRSRASTRRRSN